MQKGNPYVKNKQGTNINRKVLDRNDVQQDKNKNKKKKKIITYIPRYGNIKKNEAIILNILMESVVLMLI